MSLLLADIVESSARVEVPAAALGPVSDRAPALPVGRILLLSGTLLLILLLNFGVRRYLDMANATVPSFFEVVYKEQLPAIQSYPWWRYLLPIKELTGSWSTTGLLLVHGLEHVFGKPHYVYYFTNAVMIAAAFVLSWGVFRSYWFSTTLALCFALSTHNHHVYFVSGTVVLPLVIAYLLFFLFCQYRLLEGPRNLLLWVPLGVLSLLVYMLSYEGWLDCFVYMWLAYPFLIAWFARRGDYRRALLAGSILGAVTCFAIAYVVVKTKFGYGQVEGSESDVVFNYRGADGLIAVEDVVSHYFTIFYIGLSNFLPPQLLVNSTSAWKFGYDHLVGLQNGYHSGYSHLVMYNHMFLWRYYAGFALALCCLLLYKAVRRAFTTQSPHGIVVALCLLMVLTAGPTHILVKWRPMHAVPTLGYHAYLGVVGVSLLLAYGAHYAMKNLRCRSLAYVLVTVCWLNLAYGALARPSMLSHLNSAVGFPPYPDAMANFRKLLSK